VRKFLLVALALLLAGSAQAVIVTSEVTIMDPTADLQAAIDATPDGGALRLAVGTFVADTDSGWTIRKKITIEGQGQGTVLRPHHGDTSTPDVNARGFTIINTGGVTIRNLMIENTSTPSTTAAYDSLGAGVLVDNSDNTAAVRSFSLENVVISHMGGWGVVLDGGDGYRDRSINSARILSCDLSLNQSGGLKIIRCMAPTVRDVYSHDNSLYGAWLIECGMPRLIDSYFDGNQVASTDAVYQSQVRLDSSNGGEVSSCGFETFYDYTNKTGLTLNNCYASNIHGCFFGNADSVSGTTSIRLVANTRGATIGPNYHSLVTYAVYGAGPVAIADSSAASVGIEGIFVEQQSIMVATSGTDCPGSVSIPSDHNTYNLTFGRADGVSYRIYGLRFPGSWD
jgi:hypothetical protein